MVWGIFALVLVLFAILVLPFAASRVTDFTQQSLQGFSEDISNLALALRNAEASLDQTIDVLESSASALDAAQVNLEQLDPMLASVDTLLGVEMPEIVLATQDALEATQEGAAAMDRVLRTLSSIGFLTGVRYDPEQPLDLALQGVARSLDRMPAAFRSVSKDLQNFSVELSAMELEIGASIEALHGMASSIRAFRGTVSDQAIALEDLALDLNTFSGLVGRWVTIAVLLVEFVLLQLLASQTVVFLFGRQLLRGSESAR
jgi:hypothetical protein